MYSVFKPDPRGLAPDLKDTTRTRTSTAHADNNIFPLQKWLTPQTGTEVNGQGHYLKQDRSEQSRCQNWVGSFFAL
jgi:hypothetical protein